MSKVEIVYMGCHAFTKCECGKDIGLVNFNNKYYEGKCSCGNSYRLRNNQLALMPKLVEEGRTQG